VYYNSAIEICTYRCEGEVPLTSLPLLQTVPLPGIEQLEMRTMATICRTQVRTVCNFLL